jgi:DNA-binding MarR family transcriptional regulator
MVAGRDRVEEDGWYALNFKVLGALLGDKRVTPKTWQVLMVLVSSMDGESNQVTAKVGEMVKDAGVAIQTVIRAIRLLEAMGILVRLTRPRCKLHWEISRTFVRRAEIVGGSR